MRCARCQADNPADTSFCGRCGSRLDRPAGAPPLHTRTIPVRTPAPAAGRIINEKYRVIGEIGRGGMGLVFKAEDLQLKRIVAIKFLSAELVGGADHRSRFLREARMASALSHPHICVIHEIGEENGAPYIAMEYVAGRPLKEAVAAGRSGRRRCPLRPRNGVGHPTRPREGNRPSRPEERQRHDHAGLGGQGPRFRPGQARGCRQDG